MAGKKQGHLLRLSWVAERGVDLYPRLPSLKVIPRPYWAVRYTVQRVSTTPYFLEVFFLGRTPTVGVVGRGTFQGQGNGCLDLAQRPVVTAYRSSPSTEPQSFVSSLFLVGEVRSYKPRAMHGKGTQVLVPDCDPRHWGREKSLPKVQIWMKIDECFCFKTLNFGGDFFLGG